MKTTILLLLVLSMLVVGCATKVTEQTGEEVTAGEIQTAEQASDAEVDNIVLPEDSEIEIGEMV